MRDGRQCGEENVVPVIWGETVWLSAGCIGHTGGPGNTNIITEGRCR